MREVALSGNLNNNQHALHVELLADFAAKRDKEYYKLLNECNDLKTIALHLGEDKVELLEANRKLVAAITYFSQAVNAMYGEATPPAPPEHRLGKD